MLPHRKTRTLWNTALATVLAAALLTISLASVWHHHDDGDDNDGCSVCAVIADSSHGTLPPPAQVIGRPVQIDVLILMVQADASVAVLAEHPGRGPPIA